MDERQTTREMHGYSRVSAGEDPSLVALLRQVLGERDDRPREFSNTANSSADIPAVERIGRFEVIEVLGRGGYGTVLRVRDPRLGCERAMKLPNPETLESPTALARFMDEARKAARIDHPNVVRVVEAEEVFSLYYMVMEYCPGGSLSGWLARRGVDQPIPPRWGAALVAEIADGVQQAHSVGLLHRDLKPGNVMLVRVDDRSEADPPRFQPKVGDFGLAKALGDSSARVDRTATGTMIGTLAYMSPEQARGDKSIGAAADIHGLGAILYEILTRSTPHAGASEAEILSRILDDGPTPSPRSLRPDLPRDLETICQTALAKRPGDRYATAAELADDLRRYLRNDPVKGAPWWKRARGGLRRHRMHAAVAALAVVALGAAAAGIRYKERKDASVWLTRVEAANLGALPALLAERDPPGARQSELLARHYEDEVDPSRKIVIAIALASSRSDCARYAVERLLEARPEEIAPIVQGLDGRIKDLVPALKSAVEAAAFSSSHPGDRERQDRRRANAATALILLGWHDAGFQMLAFSADPQARSILIHTLGPARVPPSVLHAKLVEPTTETSVRRALIQALGEVPTSAWDDAEQARAAATVLKLFRDDPDPGIHASAKWLLRKWDQYTYIHAIELDLAKEEEPRVGFRWRVSRSGLTFVTIDDPETGRVIEISDTEGPRDLFLRFVPDHRYKTEASPDPDCPITGIYYIAAARFCNSLTDLDGLGEKNHCYGKASLRSIEPVNGADDRTGYRLLTDREFRLACRAGTTTARYHGETASLLPYYAWFTRDDVPRGHPVAQLKPNDFGLFDMLGNAYELCHFSEAPADSAQRAIFCGGSATLSDLGMRYDETRGPTLIDQWSGVNDVGLRVARTVRPRVKNDAR